MARMAWRTAAVIALLPLLSAAPPPPASLAFTVNEGRNLNAFYRSGSVAAHLLLRSGLDPRLLIAFPAGNSGAGIWFDRLEKPVGWHLDAPPAAITGTDSRGRTLRGISATVSVAVPELHLRGAALSSVRVLRDYERTGDQPSEVIAKPVFGPRSVRWERDRLDGAAGYRLALEILDGRVEGSRILAGADGRITLRLNALTGETPLVPIAGAQLLNTRAVQDPAARRTLEFLSFREKFLAGSWRFNTYFGRDTLMSVRLLMPVLQPQAIEAGLGSVLARLSPAGEVAHEEDVGEFAILDHMRANGTRGDAPVYDYKMVDGTPMLAPVAAHWLLDDPRGRRRAAAFLAAPASLGRSNGAALAASLRRVIEQAGPFAADPRASNLVGLKLGQNVGNWRDSEEGLGGGRYAYDVNAVLMPAALRAAERLRASGLLDRWLDSTARSKLSQAGAMARVWRTRAPGLFQMSVPADEARRAVAAAAREFGIEPRAALAALPQDWLRFPAVALDASGHAVPVLHSDEGFALLFGEPGPQELDNMIESVMRPFPAGLMSGAGMLVANPVFAPPSIRTRFTRNHYHGMVVWSWQQALLLAGLDRQLQRRDLPHATRVHVAAARTRLASVIAATRSWRTSELWTWAAQDRKIVPAAFGAAAADADESNAAQLWSCVFLALRLN